MKPYVKRLSVLLAAVMMAGIFVSCNGHTYAKGDSKLLPAASLSTQMQKENVVVVDMQSPEDYAAGHVAGAVNIPSSDIVIDIPVKNMLTTASKLETVLRASGISNDTSVLVYDSDKMSAARFLWTLFMYGHENVMVIDGGVSAIKAAGVPMDTAAVTPTPGTFTAGSPSQNWLATMKDVQAQVNNPDANVILLDVRSDEEYQTEGKIPTAIMRNYLTNYYADGTLKNAQTTKIDYLEAGIFPEKQIIIYCKTSFRAAPVFLELYEAGYRNLKIYDGAWLEWTSYSDNPIEHPQGSAAPSQKDAS